MVAGPTRTVLVERVSSDISSTSATSALAGRAGGGVLDVDDLASSFMRPVVPALAASWTARPSLKVAVALVAAASGLQPVLDAVGELGLAGVVRDLPVDPGRSCSSSVQIARRRACPSTSSPSSSVTRPASISSPRFAGRHVDADVVVTRLARPTRGRIVGGQRVHRGGSVGQVLDRSVPPGGRTRRSRPGCPQAQRDVARGLAHRTLHHRSEVLGHPPGSAMMSTLPSSAEAIRRSSLTPSPCRHRGSRTGTSPRRWPGQRRAARASRAGSPRR